MKRRQFAKMQKALYADERISKVAENPRTHAFMRSIQDMGSDDDMDFILPPGQDGACDTGFAVTGWRQRQGGLSRMVPMSPFQIASRQRTRFLVSPALADVPRQTGSPPPSARFVNRCPISLRKRATTFRSLRILSSPRRYSDLIAKEKTTPRRSPSTPTRRTATPGVVEMPSSTASRSSEIAAPTFQPPPTPAEGGLHLQPTPRQAAVAASRSPPSYGARDDELAQVDLFVVHEAGRHNQHRFRRGESAVDGNGGLGTEAKIKRNASKRSGVNYFARENERRALLAEKDKRREAKKINRAEGRGKDCRRTVWGWQV